jgi:hypothetical protein
MYMISDATTALLSFAAFDFAKPEKIFDNGHEETFLGLLI